MNSRLKIKFFAIATSLLLFPLITKAAIIADTEGNKVLLYSTTTHRAIRISSAREPHTGERFDQLASCRILPTKESQRASPLYELHGLPLTDCLTFPSMGLTPEQIDKVMEDFLIALEDQMAHYQRFRTYVMPPLARATALGLAGVFVNRLIGGFMRKSTRAIEIGSMLGMAYYSLATIKGLLAYGGAWGKPGILFNSNHLESMLVRNHVPHSSVNYLAHLVMPAVTDSLRLLAEQVAQTSDSPSNPATPLPRM